MAPGETLEALLGALGADKAGGQGQQILDPYGEQATCTGR